MFYCTEYDPVTRVIFVHSTLFLYVRYSMYAQISHQFHFHIALVASNNKHNYKTSTMKDTLVN